MWERATPLGDNQFDPFELSNSNKENVSGILET